jgi:hypothetical protein
MSWFSISKIGSQLIGLDLSWPTSFWPRAPHGSRVPAARHVAHTRPQVELKKLMPSLLPSLFHSLSLSASLFSRARPMARLGRSVVAVTASIAPPLPLRAKTRRRPSTLAAPSPPHPRASVPPSVDVGAVAVPDHRYLWPAWSSSLHPSCAPPWMCTGLRLP